MGASRLQSAEPPTSESKADTCRSLDFVQGHPCPRPRTIPLVGVESHGCPGTKSPERESSESKAESRERHVWVPADFSLLNDRRRSRLLNHRRRSRRLTSSVPQAEACGHPWFWRSLWCWSRQRRLPQAAAAQAMPPQQRTSITPRIPRRPRIHSEACAPKGAAAAAHIDHVSHPTQAEDSLRGLRAKGSRRSSAHRSRLASHAGRGFTPRPARQREPPQQRTSITPHIPRRPRIHSEACAPKGAAAAATAPIQNRTCGATRCEASST